MVSVTLTTIIFQLNRIFNLKNNDSVPLYTTWNLEFTWFNVSGLETTKPRLSFCNIAEAHGYPSWRLETGISLTNASSRSIKSFFSEVTKKWMETKQFRISEWKQILTVKWKIRWKKLLTIFIAYILIVLFALLPKISSIVYKKGRSMSASNKLTFWFP